MSARIGTLDQGTTVAVLDVPTSQASTDVVARTTRLQIEHVPFAVPGNAHQVFSQFLTDTTDDASKTFGLSGYANSELLPFRACCLSLIKVRSDRGDRYRSASRRQYRLHGFDDCGGLAGLERTASFRYRPRRAL